METNLDPVTAFLMHDQQSAIIEDENRVSEEFKDTPPKSNWDGRTPPEWAAECWGSVGHDWMDCPVCQVAYDRWMNEGFEDFTEDDELYAAD